MQPIGCNWESAIWNKAIIQWDAAFLKEIFSSKLNIWGCQELCFVMIDDRKGVKFFFVTIKGNSDSQADGWLGVKE